MLLLWLYICVIRRDFSEGNHLLKLYALLMEIKHSFYCCIGVLILNLKLLLGCQKSHDIFFCIFCCKNVSRLFRQPDRLIEYWVTSLKCPWCTVSLCSFDCPLTEGGVLWTKAWAHVYAPIPCPHWGQASWATIVEPQNHCHLRLDPDMKCILDIKMGWNISFPWSQLP